MKKPNFVTSYRSHTERFKAAEDEIEAMAQSVGGELNAVGALEFCLLKDHGLQPDSTVVDVGCGSGRLAYQLKDFLTGRYVGFDVVPDLFEYARRLCARDDFVFYEAPGLHIPEPDSSADLVCFFSVITHLLHEESYVYLRDAARVIKPGGRIVVSFLEFQIASHWTVFENSILDTTPDKVLNQFVSRDALGAWADHLGLDIVEIQDGDKPHITLDRVIDFEDGRTMTDRGNLGQSVIVFTKA